MNLFRGLVFFLACAQIGFAAEPTLAVALGKLQASDFAGAAQMLAEVTKNEPSNGRPWRNLGLAYGGLKDWKSAIDAYEGVQRA